MLQYDPRFRGPRLRAVPRGGFGEFSGFETAAAYTNAARLVSQARAMPSFGLFTGITGPFHSWYFNLVNHLALVDQRNANAVDAAGNLTPALTAALTDYAANLQSEIVSSLYRKYENSSGDAAGRTFWLNELTTGRKTPAELEGAFVAAHPTTTTPTTTTPTTTTPTTTTPTTTPAAGGGIFDTLANLSTPVKIGGAVVLGYLVLGGMGDGKKRR